MSEPRPTTGDAFGAALHEYLEKGARARRIHVIERDDGFVDTADTGSYFAPVEQWNELDRWALDGINGRVLDVGAGAGRASVLLQERGCDVVALDSSPLAIDVCSRRGVAQTFAGTVQDLAKAQPPRFDSFVLLGNNLGLLRDRDYCVSFLALLAGIATPDATIAGTCLDPYGTEEPEHLAYHARNVAAGRMGGQVRMRVRHRTLATPWWDWLFMSLDELSALVGPSRWKIVDSRSDGPVYAVRLRRKRGEGR